MFDLGSSIMEFQDEVVERARARAAWPVEGLGGVDEK